MLTTALHQPLKGLDRLLARGTNIGLMNTSTLEVKSVNEIVRVNKTQQHDILYSY